MKPEEEFEDFLRDIEFDDKPDYAFRDKLEQSLHTSFTSQSRQKPQSFKTWRYIMNSKITKLSAAAAILILITIFGWLYSNPDSVEQISSFTLLARASAAERTLYYGPAGIVHIVNEIIMYPQQDRDATQLLRDLEADPTQDKNIAFMKNWLSYQWLPVCSLRADGKLQEHKLELAKHMGKTITILDISWFDPATGRFARVLKTNDQVLFANAYDGESVYLTRKGPGGIARIEGEAVTSEFQVPGNPADFMGIAAGMKGTVPGKHYPPILDVTSETLDDDTSARVYKLGFIDAWKNAENYLLFKVRSDTDIISEIECVVKGTTTRVHRRLVGETVDSPEFSWNLSELDLSSTDQAGIDVDTVEGAKVVTIQQIAQRATFPVYIFAQDPVWTNQRLIYDLPDETNLPDRFYCATYRAKDSRDIALTQGGSFIRYFNALFNQALEQGDQVPWTYESENGFKVFHQNDKETEMWWTEVALKSSGFEPHANRVGYILMSPESAFMVLAINGPVSEQELQSLVDSLIPADEYVPGSFIP